jgi:hypothetical protein
MRRPRTIVRALALSLPVLVAACQAPDPTFVAAARAFYDAVAPEYAAYVAGDPALDAGQKARREKTLARFREAIEVREVAK